MSSVGNCCSCAENTTVFASIACSSDDAQISTGFLEAKATPAAQLWQTNSIVHPSVGLSVAHRLERYRLLQPPACAALSWLQPGS